MVLRWELNSSSTCCWHRAHACMFSSFFHCFGWWSLFNKSMVFFCFSTYHDYLKVTSRLGIYTCSHSTYNTDLRTINCHVNLLARIKMVIHCKAYFNDKFDMLFSTHPVCIITYFAPRILFRCCIENLCSIYK